MTPNKDIMARWIAALRNGEYKQGKYLLRDAENNYCCYGVLADLWIKETGGVDWKGPFSGGEDDHSPHYTHLGYRAITSPIIEKWAGIYGIGQVIEGGIYYDKINDEGASFEDIAKHIAQEVGIE